MARIASILTCVAVALWLGGMIFLFIAVQTLFASFPKASGPVALEAAPRLFAAFEKYQLILAIVSLLASFVWYFATRSKLVMTLFILLALSAAGAAISSTLISAKLQRLRAEGQSGSPAFMKLHGQSMIVYTSQAALLLAAAIVLPVATTLNAPHAPPSHPSRRTETETAEA